MEEKINNDFERFKEVEKRLSNLENSLLETDNQIANINKSIQMIGESQITLLRHFSTGNGQKEMETEAEKLTQYFIEN